MNQSPVAHFRQQEHFPPNNFVLEDKRTEGLYKAQKQMSFIEFTILTHSLQAPLVATDEGVILLRLFIIIFFSNLQVFFLVCHLAIYFLKCLDGDMVLVEDRAPVVCVDSVVSNFLIPWTIACQAPLFIEFSMQE